MTEILHVLAEGGNNSDAGSNLSLRHVDVGIECQLRVEDDTSIKRLLSACLGDVLLPY